MININIYHPHWIYIIKTFRILGFGIDFGEEFKFPEFFRMGPFIDNAHMKL